VPADPADLARSAALLYAHCRWSGFTPRSGNDCLIACCAIDADEPLLHEDRDFESIARVEPALILLSR
jgi:predicted nucleic acid-binding protein